MNDKHALVELLIRSGALCFGDFITKSGRNTPYFINTAKLCSASQVTTLSDIYADAIAEKTGGDFQALYGPAYKGIPLAALTAASLWRRHGMDKPFFFNRKEVKDHGEGGALVGYAPRVGDRVVVVEDVITAGTALRETLAILAPTGVIISSLFVSVDRCERGNGPRAALSELQDELGIAVCPLVTIHEVVACLHGKPLDGKVYIDDEIKARIDAYLDRYGA